MARRIDDGANIENTIINSGNSTSSRSGHQTMPSLPDTDGIGRASPNGKVYLAENVCLIGKVKNNFGITGTRRLMEVATSCQNRSVGLEDGRRNFIESTKPCQRFLACAGRIEPSIQWLKITKHSKAVAVNFSGDG